MYDAAEHFSSAPADSSASGSGFFVLCLVVIGCVAVLALAIRAAHRRTLVVEASVAMKRLIDLNARSGPHIVSHSSINMIYRYRAESKGKYDRFDLGRFLGVSVLENESWFEREVSVRVRALELYSAYRTTIQRECESMLATSSHPKVKREQFVAIERKVFNRTILPRPVPAVRVAARVTYTSPKGQNSYSRDLTWDFEALHEGLRAGQAARARQSTTAALRARERSFMTMSLRADILRRDGYRCKMCGAAGSDGAELHIDHIIPVSRDGRTVADNLQTLCAPCNLGKGNRFIG
ncbi:HNH endonuclease [Amnibacterium kyonggiense]|uniref:HNH endonuclease n=1 Tax=Amnibacterium kyonggiense TaxID=595671 RepID=UPI001FEAE1C9|nr:HNH endonuclease signature motif containing protein [Amnibacterium kyonggiense]